MERLKRMERSFNNSTMEKSCWQIYCKNWFFDWSFYVTIADADIGSLKSLHTLFDKYLDHMLMKFEQFELQNFEFFDKNV